MNDDDLFGYCLNPKTIPFIMYKVILLLQSLVDLPVKSKILYFGAHFKLLLSDCRLKRYRSMLENPRDNIANDLQACVVSHDHTCILRIRI